MDKPPPEHPKGLSRTRTMVATLLAEVVGVILIVAVVPFSWSVRLVLVAVYLGLVHYTSLAYLRRHRGG